MVEPGYWIRCDICGVGEYVPAPIGVGKFYRLKLDDLGFPKDKEPDSVLCSRCYNAIRLGIADLKERKEKCPW